jgi:tRNA threonylcarbamoyladenosine biosynthesis protein TsaE
MHGEVAKQAAETCVLATGSAEETEAAGRSLAKTVYDGPLTIALSGELGAGKTTFLRGFFRGLGAKTDTISPTYALEQRHPTNRGEALHLDLYRLTPRDARELLGSTDEHPGIRAVEWYDRIETDADASPRIDLAFQEDDDRNRRTIRCTFRDAVHPPKGLIEDLRKQMRLPAHIIKHCDAVAGFCDVLADALIARGVLVRKKLLHEAARFHDLFRFVDFRPGSGPADYASSAEDEHAWKPWAKKYPGIRHEAACAAFLRDEGYAMLAAIVETHGLELPSSLDRVTTEQRLLYYADKRVNQTEVVSLRERFDDFIVRYGKGVESPKARGWYDEAVRVERELFSDRIP